MSVESSRPGDRAQRNRPRDLPLIFFVARWRWPWLVLGAGICAIVAFVIASLFPPIYTAKVTLLPQSRDEEADLLGRFAGMTGIALPAIGSSEDLYGRIVTSNRILDTLLDRKWQRPKRGDEVSLYEVMGVRLQGSAQDSLRAREKAREALRRKSISFSRDRLTGFMEIRVSIPRDAELAAAIANEAVAQLNAFDRQYLKGKATSQREYTEARLQRVTSDLESAEADLTSFLRMNRRYAESPDLQQRFQALQREVEAQTGIWLELKRQLEIARLDEHKQLVSIDVLDPAISPIRRSSPRRGSLALFGAVFGALAAVCYGSWRELSAGGSGPAAPE